MFFICTDIIENNLKSFHNFISRHNDTILWIHTRRNFKSTKFMWVVVSKKKNLFELPWIYIYILVTALTYIQLFHGTTLFFYFFGTLKEQALVSLEALLDLSESIERWVVFSKNKWFCFLCCRLYQSKYIYITCQYLT